MSRTYKTKFSRYAEDDLLEILDYFSSINSAHAEKLLDVFEKRVGELKKYPERGRIVPELQKQNIIEYRELIEGNYRIIFVIEGDEVIIHTIIDGRRDFEDLIMSKLLKFYK
jgi:toxin ParE1/3/4